MPITPLPPPPQRNEPASFADKGDALLGALPAFVSEANALEANVDAKEVIASAAANTATAASNAAVAATGATVWVSGTTYAIGVVRYSPINQQSYRRRTAGAGTTDPSLDPTNWTLLSSLPPQAGQNGRVLTSNGESASWADTGFQSGTVMLFIQTTAPTGWTKSTTHNNKALRIVSGTAGSGGSAAFTTAFASRTPAGSVTVGATTLTTAQMPAHTHTQTVGLVTSVQPGSGAWGGEGFSGATGEQGGGGSHTHTGTFTGTAMDFAVQYVDAIIATKN